MLTGIACSGASWAEPTAEGECPDGYPIKAKLGSKIFHAPGQLNYDRTTPDRCYVDAEAAWELTVACAQAHLSGSVARPATPGGPGRALGTPASRPGDRSLPSPHAPIAPGGPGAGCT